jgi:hypothetical protein
MFMRNSTLSTCVLALAICRGEGFRRKRRPIRVDAWLADGADRCLEQVAEAVLRNLRLVSISLDADDDAQVIFETLNGRGAELHATDLGELRPNDLASPRTRRRHRPPAGRPGPGCVKSASGVMPRQQGSFWTHRAPKSPESVL